MEHINSSRRAPFGSNPLVGETGRATQRRILAAAADTFAETGYARTSVEAITDRAGCSRPTFYQYFSGKEDLHRRLAGRMGAELSDAIGHLERVTPDEAGRAVLRDWFASQAEIYARHRAVADNFSASLRTDERMATGAADLSAVYRQAMLRALDPAAMSTDDIEVLTGAANVVAYGACIHRQRLGDIPTDRLADGLADTLHRVFFGPLVGVNLAPRRPSSLPTEPRPEPASAPTESTTTTRHQRGVQTRQRLLDAAHCAYGTLGFDAVRVDDIATEAGVSHGTFYRYFADKDAIFDEHADRVTEELLTLLADLPREPDQARAWAESYYAYYSREGAIVSCLRDAVSAGSRGATRARRDTVAALSAALDKRSFGDTDADVVACVALLENVPAAAYGYSGFSIDDAVSATAAILTRAIFVDPTLG